MREAFQESHITEHQDTGLSQEEVRLYSKLFPDFLEDPSPFVMEGTPLSLYETAGLAELVGTKSGVELRTMLQDTVRLERVIRERTDDSPDTERLLWTFLAQRPQWQERLQDKLSGTAGALVVRSESDIARIVPSRTRLAQGKLPTLKTYAEKLHPEEKLEGALAEVTFLGPDGEAIQTVPLSASESQALLNYAVGLRSGQIPKATQERILKRRIQKFVARRSEQGGDWKNFEVQWNFFQLKFGADKQLAELLKDPNIVRRSFGLPEKDATAAEMIDLKKSLPYLLKPGSLEWLPVRESQRRGSRKIKHRESSSEVLASGHIFNELQRAQVEINHATRTGQWGQAVELYIKYLDYWPQYLEHRAAVLDLDAKVRAGLLEEYPRTILSVASGPHEELRAQSDIAPHLGREVPVVYSLDADPNMLAKSRELLPDNLKNYGVDIVGDMRQLPPLEHDHFDLVECSSMDNLKSNDEVIRCLASLLSRAKQNGAIRVMWPKGISPELTAALSAAGVEMLSTGTQPQLSEALKEEVVESLGVKVVKRFNYKLRRQVYMLAKITESRSEEEWRSVLAGVTIYDREGRKNRNTVSPTSAPEQATELSDDENIFKAVAICPTWFLQRGMLSQVEVRTALESLRGNLDLVTAQRIITTYLTDPGLSDLAPLALQIALEAYGSRIFTIAMLSHENEEVRRIAEQFAREHSMQLEMPASIPQAEKKAHNQQEQKRTNVFDVEGWLARGSKNNIASAQKQIRSLETACLQGEFSVPQNKRAVVLLHYEDLLDVLRPGFNDITGRLASLPKEKEVIEAIAGDDAFLADTWKIVTIVRDLLAVFKRIDDPQAYDEQAVESWIEQSSRVLEVFEGSVWLMFRSRIVQDTQYSWRVYNFKNEVFKFIAEKINTSLQEVDLDDHRMAMQAIRSFHLYYYSGMKESQQTQFVHRFSPYIAEHPETVVDAMIETTLQHLKLSTRVENIKFQRSADMLLLALDNFPDSPLVKSGTLDRLRQFRDEKTRQLSVEHD